MRKISRRSFLKAATVACALTALTACGGGDESAAVSVAKDENGAYVDTLTITLGRFAEPSAAALFPEGQTFEDNAYTRYIESKLNVDLVDSFEAGGDAFTNQLATCVASGELPDIMSVISYDTFVEMVNNGLTYDLTDVYEEYASDYIKSLYDSYDGRCLGMATFGPADGYSRHEPRQQRPCPVLDAQGLAGQAGHQPRPRRRPVHHAG